MPSGPIVVAVLSHRDPPLLRRLTDRLAEGERTVALVHHDPRGEPHGLVESDRLRLAPDPQPGDWGRMNFAMTMVRVLGVARDIFPDLAWVLLVSGQDYPAQHLRRTEEVLEAHRADALLRHFQVPVRPAPDEVPWVQRCRRRYLHRIRLPGQRRSVPFPRRHPFGAGTDLYIGDTWPNLGRSAVDHVLEQQARMGEVQRHLQWCSSPDEAWLPTLLLNDADHLQVVSERRRFIRWVEGSPHPETLMDRDLEEIERSEDFFARKVDPIRSANLLDNLDIRAERPTTSR